MIGLMILGAVMILFPKVIYVLTESWKNDVAQEPSDTYIMVTRIGGAAFLLLGLFRLLA